MTMPATLKSIEEFVEQSRAFKEQHAASSINFAMELMLREALTNAVVHGCNSNPDKTITCVLRLRANRLFFTVRDDGPGFNWRSVRQQSQTSDSSGRGLEILRKYASRLRFNGPGNGLAITKTWGAQ